MALLCSSLGSQGVCGSYPLCVCWIQGGRSVAPHTCNCIFLWRYLIYTGAITLAPTGVWIQVLPDTQMFYTELQLPLNTSYLHQYHALFANIAVVIYGSAVVEAVF
ncbi:hypothetical protein AMECASPLE_017889 [Ameca splendens]|uniref:Uncharacterized protein n=1 Tax=Ameca splendens TaxID=208324 RepID=A0ABV0YEP4_9TELE